MIIPVTITAKNEARAIGRMLDSLRTAIAYAHAHEPRLRLDPLVVLDDCADATGVIAEGRGFTCVTSSGGKVEAQRRGLRDGPFAVFADADIVIGPTVLAELASVMLAKPEVRVAFPMKHPLPPRRRTPLARALHVYNQREPATPRWFSGKLFAIRDWSIPRGVIADDIYLSRVVMRDHGAGALHRTPSPIWFRAPETIAGMYAYYSRLRSTAEQLDATLPGVRFGGEPPGILRTPLIVRGALLLCRARYALERPAPDAWPVVAESKCL